MLVFIPDQFGYARDDETGEIFGLTSTHELETLKVVYIAQEREYNFYVGVEGVRGDAKIKILCGSMEPGLRHALTGDHTTDTALVRRIIVALIAINREIREVEGAVFYSDFEAFRRFFEKRGEQIPFDMPSNDELRAMSMPH